MTPEPIDGLTATEARIFCALREVRGRVLSAGQIGDLVARDHADPPSYGAITAHICNLRRKRPDLGAQIKTCRGFGYSFSE